MRLRLPFEEIGQNRFSRVEPTLVCRERGSEGCRRSTGECRECLRQARAEICGGAGFALTVRRGSERNDSPPTASCPKTYFDACHGIAASIHDLRFERGDCNQIHVFRSSVYSLSG